MLFTPPLNAEQLRDVLAVQVAPSQVPPIFWSDVLLEEDHLLAETPHSTSPPPLTGRLFLLSSMASKVANVAPFETEFERVAAKSSTHQHTSSPIVVGREGISIGILESLLAKNPLNLPGAGYLTNMMSTIFSAVSGVGERLTRLIFNDADNISERRTYADKGNVSNKRVKLGPSEGDQVQWLGQEQLEHVHEHGKIFCHAFDFMRQTAQSRMKHLPTASIRKLNHLLEPLVFSMVDGPDELQAVRQGSGPQLASLWLRAIQEVSSFANTMYDPAHIVRLRSAHHHRVPTPFKINLDPQFEESMRRTGAFLSDSNLFHVMGSLMGFWGVTEHDIQVDLKFLDRIILDIHALEHELPPPSYVTSETYVAKLKSNFPAPARATRDRTADIPLQAGEIPGMFPEEPVQPRQRTAEPIQAAPIPDRNLGTQPARQPTRNRQAGAGLIPRGRQSPAALESISSPVQVAGDRVGKAKRLRAKFPTRSLVASRVSRACQQSENHDAIERQYITDFDPKQPLDHRSSVTLSSALRKRVPKFRNQIAPPRLRERRPLKSVRFADDTLSPQPRSRAGIELPRLDEPEPRQFPAPSLSTGSRLPSPRGSPESSEESSEPTPEPILESEPATQIAKDPDVDQLDRGLRDIVFDEFGPPKVRPQHEPTAHVPEERTEEEAKRRLDALFSLPSPAGLRQSDDSKLAIELRKQKEAAQAAEEKRKAEEKARREAKERAQRELEERLAKSGGLRLPNQQLVGPLSEDWTQRAQNTLGATPSTNLATTGEGVDLRRHDFAKVVPETEWLNDEVVNGSLNWLDRAINSAAGIKNVKTHTRKCLVMSSFFWKRLKDQGVTGTTRTLSRNGVKKENLLDIDTILLPICENSHWTLVVIRPSKRTVAHMDSMNCRGSAANTNLGLAWMKEVLQEKFDPGEWKVVRHQAPRQTNGWDCGVHTITNAMCVALGLNPIDCYSAEDMPLQRLRIACVLLNGGFKGEFDLQVY